MKIDDKIKNVNQQVNKAESHLLFLIQNSKTQKKPK